MPYRRHGIKSRLEHLRRYRHITGVLMKHGFDEVVETMSRRLTLRLGKRAIPSRIRRAPNGRTRPQRVRLVLEELGPTFIKLGQLLSTRPDVLPAAYIEELQVLQDQVAPVPFAQIREEVERELKGKLEDLFLRFDEQPLAAASIAQVHRAVLKDGRNVVLKVRRPGIVQTIRTECEILEDLAGVVKSSMVRDESVDPVKMVHEFTEAVNQEVDLANEAHNLQRFARNFRDDKTVHIPELYEPYCTPAVMTMEYIEGVKPSNPQALVAAGLEPKLVASRGAEFILKQVFDFGFFHTDPHPGNIFVLAGNVLGVLDFGQVARLNEDDRRLVGDLILSITDKDSERLIRAFQRSGMLEGLADVPELYRDIDDMLDRYYQLPLKEIPVGHIISQTFEMMRQHHIHPPAEFTLMLKSLMTIESMAANLDPDFQLLDHLRPYARKMSLEQVDPRKLWRATRRSVRDVAELLTGLPSDISAILSKAKKGEIQMRVQHEHLESLIHTIDRSSSRISFALVIAGTVVASSMLVTQRQGQVGIASYQTLGILGYVGAALMGLWLLISIIRSRHL